MAAGNSPEAMDSDPDERFFREPIESKFIKFSEFITQKINTELGRLNPSTRLYRYQIEAVLGVANHFQRSFVENSSPHEIALIVAPPGSGKSGMVTLLPYVLKSSKVMVLTPSKIISSQLAADFGDPNVLTSFFLKCGIASDKGRLGHLLEEKVIQVETQNDVLRMDRSNLVIVNAQKFSGKAGSTLNITRKQKNFDLVVEQLNEFDTIIVDEAHHYPAETWINIMSYFRAGNKKVVFLTATPYRQEPQGRVLLTDMCRDLKIIYEIKRESLEGITIRKATFIEKIADDAEFGPVFFSQLKKDINEILDRHKLMETRAPPPQAMILVRTQPEARDVAEGLGEEATYITSDKERDKNLNSFSKGEKKIAVICGMLLEGYDNPSVSLCVILRKCKSGVLFEQFVGRCIRTHRNLTGKKKDQIEATVLSYQHFGQKTMWETREKNVLAEDGPVSDDEADDNEEPEQDEPQVPKRRRSNNVARLGTDSPGTSSSSSNNSPATPRSGSGRGRPRGRPRGSGRGTTRDSSGSAFVHSAFGHTPITPPATPVVENLPGGNTPAAFIPRAVLNLPPSPLANEPPAVSTPLPEPYSPIATTPRAIASPVIANTPVVSLSSGGITPRVATTSVTSVSPVALRPVPYMSPAATPSNLRNTPPVISTPMNPPTVVDRSMLTVNTSTPVNHQNGNK